MKLMRLGALGYALTSIYLWPSKVAAAFVNGTIDDQFGDSVTHHLVNYYPTQDAWYNQCSCHDAPDKSKAFDNTYTVTIYYPPHVGVGSVGINMQFIGRIY